MANRRMFSKTITNSSAFLMMPLSSQALYMHLGMNADDDGYCEFFGIQRMCGANQDDLKLLHAKGFVQVFDEKVLIIRDWTENNYIQKDRYQKSRYLDVYKMDTERIQDVHEMDTQVRLGKDRVGEVTTLQAAVPSAEPEKNEVYLYWEQVIGPVTNSLEGARKASVTLMNRYGLEQCQKAIRVAAMAHSDQYARKEYKVLSLRSLLENWDKVWIYAKGKMSQRKEPSMIPGRPSPK
jgi:hypothetical protein